FWSPTAQTNFVPPASIAASIVLPLFYILFIDFNVIAFKEFIEFRNFLIKTIIINSIMKENIIVPIKVIIAAFSVIFRTNGIMVQQTNMVYTYKRSPFPILLIQFDKVHFSEISIIPHKIIYINPICRNV